MAVEFHSLSKTYNMTGWRIGSVVGNAEVLAGIGKIKSNIDSGTFGAVQDAGIAALNSPKEVVDLASGMSTEGELRSCTMPSTIWA